MSKRPRQNVIGVSISALLLERIDNDRGDVPRSKFLQRLLELAYLQKENVNAVLQSKEREAQDSGVPHNQK